MSNTKVRSSTFDQTDDYNFLGKLQRGGKDVLTEISTPLYSGFKPNKLEDTQAGTISWVRNGEAKYVDRYGTRKTALANVPREEAEGWLIEGPGTNSVIQSSNQNLWIKGETGTVALTVTDGTLAADNLTQAYWCHSPDTNVTLVRPSVTIPLSAGNLLTCFIDMKAKTLASYTSTVNVYGLGSLEISLDINWSNGVPTIGALTPGDIVAGSEFIKPLRDGWYMVGYSFIPITVMADDIRFRIWPDGRSSAISTNGVYLANGDCKLGPLSSHIPTTTTSETRLADDVSIQIYNNMPQVLDKLTITMTADCNGYNDNKSNYLCRVSQDVVLFAIFNENALQKPRFNYNGTNANGTTMLETNTEYDFSFVFDGVTQSMLIDGVLVASATSSQTPGDMSPFNLNIGRSNVSDFHLNGHIKNLNIYDDEV